MIDPFELLNAVTYVDKVNSIIRSGTQTLLRSWRDEGGTDDEIYRKKLASCGWRYSRQKGQWVHPKAPDYRAPKDLPSFAKLMAETTLKDALDKKC